MDISALWGDRWPVAVVAGLLCCYVTFSTIRQYNRLAHFPGPRSAAWSRWWTVRATAAGDLYLRLLEVSRKYGHLARVGPNDLVTDDPGVLREINGLRSPFIRSDWYSSTAISHKEDHVFSMTDDKRHADRRTKLIPGYSGREIEGLEATMDVRIEDLCDLINAKYLSSDSSFQPVDLSRLCSFYTLEVIYSLAFGQTMGFLEHDRDVFGYLANQKAMLPVFEWLGTLPYIQRLLRLPGISENVMPKKTDKTGVGLLLAFAENAIKDRRANKRRDILSSFLEHGVTDEEAEQEATVQIIAGSDTTATTMRMGLFFIMTNPRVWLRLRNDIQEAEQRGISTPISDAEARQIPFLEACIKETLRMWPPVVGMNGKIVPAGGAELLGKFIPGGTQINYSAWAVQRSATIYGNDVDMFRPERWLPGGSPGLSLEEMNATMDLVFGYGKNACLGKPIGLIELRKTVGELVRRYDMSVVHPDKPFVSVNRNGLFIQDDLLVRLEKRRS